MTRKFLRLAVLGLIILSMTACGDDSNSKDTVEKLQKFTTTKKARKNISLIIMGNGH